MKTKIKIIIVDDHEIVRDGIAALLFTADNMEVTGEAANAGELFSLLESNFPDLILLDISLPGMSGIEIAKKLKQQYREIKVLMLTAEGTRENIKEATKTGVNGFILKNAGKQTLLQAIKSVSRGEMFYDPQISSSLAGLLSEINQDNVPGKTALTSREQDILKQLVEGKSHKQVAAQLYISKRTVDTHVNNMMQKLDLHTKAELITYAIRNKIVEI